MMNANEPSVPTQERVERKQKETHTILDAKCDMYTDEAMEFADKLGATGTPCGVFIAQCIMSAIGDSLLRRAKGGQP